jgi:hypothetical protein
MSAHLRQLDRVEELLADRAVQGLDASERAELEKLLSGGGDSMGDDYSLEAAAAAIELSFVRFDEVLPTHVRERLMRTADAYLSAAPASRAGIRASDVLERIGPGVSSAGAGSSAGASSSRAESGVAGSIGGQRSSGVPGWGWFAAAASLLIAVAGWWPRFTAPGATDAALANLAEQRVQLIATAPDLVQSTWTDWELEGQGPEIKGVSGDVVFSPQTQSGYMRFVGLPPNPAGSQYQLWVIDERGLSQRVSGAIFDARGDGELIVPVQPRIVVGKPALFAITIEKPGGTWVSDMKRRVCVAAFKG